MYPHNKPNIGLKCGIPQNSESCPRMLNVSVIIPVGSILAAGYSQSLCPVH